MKHLLLIFCTALALSAADATGKWTGTLTIDTQSDQPRPAHLVLKQDGGKLTGTAGPNAGEQHAIQNGKAEDGTLTFELSQGESIMRFTLKLEGDEMKGGITREREGLKETAKLSVKRDNN